MLIRDMELDDIKGNPDAEITGISYDSRKVEKGNIFVAIGGDKVDGHRFIKDAVRQGAAAVIYDHAVNDKESVRQDSEPVFIRVYDSRKALAYISNNFYERPSQHITVIGITGTNGKTTTTYILKSILETWGKSVGLIGTINYLIKDRHFDAPYTTPQAPEFQSILKQMLSEGCNYVVTEVSSHALAQRRVDYTDFKVAVFTNLTRDHLDFHVTMEDYFKAKQRLFNELLSKDGTAVINFDDLWGRRLIEDFKGNVLTYGIESGADVSAANIKDAFDGLTMDVKYNGRSGSVKSHLIGMHNVYNILSAIGASISLNIPWNIILEGISRTGTVRGRFEKVSVGQNFLCIVDYAHTEDALERLIYTARELIQSTTATNLGKIITVFGCGGNRDKGKRPKMGAIATKLSDYVVITSDNPRFEEPMDIIKEIESGAKRNNYIIEPDREKAIRKAVEIAQDGDILLVAGKGHEDYQEVKGTRHKFSDREILMNSLKDRLKNA